MSTSQRIAIAGAGIAGLTTALALGCLWIVGLALDGVLTVFLSLGLITPAVATATPHAQREARTTHHRHAVVAIRAGLAVVHAVAAPAERAVAEATRQLQQRLQLDYDR